MIGTCTVDPMDGERLAMGCNHQGPGLQRARVAGERQRAHQVDLRVEHGRRGVLAVTVLGATPWRPGAWRKFKGEKGPAGFRHREYSLEEGAQLMQYTIAA